ncbi:DUF1343 domain-containing protein [bacterium]|nr:DUF1343 domain-containing protein [bacterium]
MIKLGIDIFEKNLFKELKDQRIGLVAHPASATGTMRHTAEVLYENQDEGYHFNAILGPQHGFFGQTQDNMIEWEGFIHPDMNIPVFSLYGEHRKPTKEMLQDIDTLVFDLQDVGTRYYTFIWTMALCMEACAENSVKMIILDRPNPINGADLEGPVLEERFSSFVGLYPIPIRHGMTIGELGMLFNKEYDIKCELSVIRMEGWKREMYYDKTGLLWVLPSPNMPTLETAIVYPGICLLEATNISEGRGTTKPFEIIGAPFIHPADLARNLGNYELPGVKFRPLRFQPMFSKWQGEVCGGIQIHVINRQTFMPVLTGLCIIGAIKRMYPSSFAWRQPPYEYELEKSPFDVLTGNKWVKEMIDKGESPVEFQKLWENKLNKFKLIRKKYLLY